MVRQISLGGISVDVIQKDIRNIHLSVHPPEGKVRISAPLRMDIDTLRVFVIGKLAWIKSQQKKLRAQERETEREFLDGESHYVWGRRYLLKIEERDAAPEAELKPRRLILCVRPETGRDRMRDILDSWYREQLRAELPALLSKWEPLMGVKAGRFFVQKMRTKWGSCSRSGNIRINTELAKKPLECLEYIVVHELAHLFEPTHNQRFIELMDRFMPKWKLYKDQLNRLPVRHEDWSC